MKRCDLAVVGAGPGGLAAAAEALEHGLSVTLFDDHALPGGQYFRHPPRSLAKPMPGFGDKDAARAAELFRILDHPRLAYRPETVVWDAPEADVLAFAGGAESGRIKLGAIVLAAGAHDRAVPFPGWTLPGVMTAGAVQNLIKGQRVTPGGRVVVAGNGPLSLVVAVNLHRAGVEVVAVVEAAALNRRLLSQLPRLCWAPALVRLAVALRLALIAAGIPLRTAETVVEAHGEDAVRAVTTAPIDGAGRLDRGRARTLEVDTLVTGFGLTPAVELTRLLGCDHRFEALRGGWLPLRSAALETTVPGVFAVGDGAGIGGVEIALLEGRLAALNALARLRGGAAAAAQGRRRALVRRLARLYRFRAGLERLFAPPRHFLELITPETVVCRCEEVTAAELRRRAAEGATSMSQLKATTRTGMGRCQGRNCLATLAALVAQAHGLEPGALAWPKARPPARPIPLGYLLHETLPPPELPDDPHFPRRPPPAG